MKNEMAYFERRFSEALSGSVVPMDSVLHHVGAVAGKRLRPRLVFLSAQLFGEVNESTWRTALYVELLHTATLIHDDVVDESDMRRGQASVNARWNNRVAVLAGDYLLAKAMMLLSNPEDHLILKEMLDTTLAMSEGEVMQSEAWNSESGEQKTGNKERYLEIITRKTAMLFRACCVGGALSVNSSLPTTHSSLLTDFGLHFGRVFQMRDDILDNDAPETTALAKQLLPEYLDHALNALDALEPYVKNKEVLSSLRAWIS